MAKPPRNRASLGANGGARNGSLLVRVLDRLEEWLIALLMASATALIFVAVVHRYASALPVPLLQDWLLKVNLSWAQELCIYLFIWMAKFGAAYGVRTGIHVGVDVLINQLPDRGRATLIVLGLLAGAIFTGVIGTLGAGLVWDIAHTEQVSADLELPMWIVYLAIPCGSYLMCFRFLQVTLWFLRTGELPHHDVAKVEGLRSAAQDALHPAPVQRAPKP